MALCFTRDSHFDDYLNMVRSTQDIRFSAVLAKSPDDLMVALEQNGLADPGVLRSYTRSGWQELGLRASTPSSPTVGVARAPLLVASKGATGADMHVSEHVDGERGLRSSSVARSVVFPASAGEGESGLSSGPVLLDEVLWKGKDEHLETNLIDRYELRRWWCARCRIAESRKMTGSIELDGRRADEK